MDTTSYLRLQLLLRRTVDFIPRGIHNGQNQQRQYGCAKQAGPDGDRHWPEEDIRRQGNHRQNRRRGCQQNRPKPGYRSVNDRIPQAFAGGAVLVNLVHQNNRVAHDNPGKGQYAELHDKPKRFPRQEEAGGNADDA